MTAAFNLSPLSRDEDTRASAEEHLLAEAFASFSHAAASLEHSYSQLRTEVARLRHDLETSQSDLSTSRDQNRCMRQRLDRIMESLPCGVLVLETDGSTSLSNPETVRLLGGPLSGSPPAGLGERLRQNLSDGAEFEYHGAGEAAEWITVRRAQLPAEDGGSAIFILQDVSRLKRLQQEHETLERRQALAELAAVLAHEIRNPLGSLELFAGLLGESQLAAEERLWVEHLQAGLRTLAATVNNVLHFHSQPLPGFVPTDLGQLLASLASFLRPLAQQARVQICLQSSLDGVWVAADRHGVEQVVLNLALNSFRCMPGGGVLRISGHAMGGSALPVVRLEIADTGPGIAPEHLPRIFQPGFSTRPGSPGLGLAVCKMIMEQHGGAISVASPPGLGATFILEFPFSGAKQ